MSPGRSSAPLISVVIPTCRRPALLARCLDAVEHQTLSSEAYEIIVVDDGRTDQTRALCEQRARAAIARGLAIRYLRPQGRQGPAAARNCGWRAAAGDIIAFTDDDTIPDRDWLRQGEIGMQAGQRVALWGRVHVPMPEILTDNARNTAGLENATFVTANAFVRRRALDAVGGFDERYRRAWREDTDLYFALLRAAPWPGAVVAAPQALVLHPVREARFLVSIGQQANMSFDALLFKKYPDLYDRHIGFRHPPVDYCAIVLATLLALIALPLDSTIAAAFALVALLLILRFAARRLRGVHKSPRQVLDVVISSFAIPYVSLYWRLDGALRWRAGFY
jgi:glycosyltransferase involved in cell wall biosynthesis